MLRAKGLRLTGATEYFLAAFPRCTIKHIERAIGCSPSQAHRMYVTGHVPRQLRTQVLAVLDKAIASNVTQLEQRLMKLRKLGHDEAVIATGDRAQAPMGTNPQAAEGLDRGTEEPPLID